MKFFTDSYFQIGNAHLGSGKPCQDYAMSEGDEKFAFAIVSDGCSSGGETDVGSRLVALSTASAIKNNWILEQNVNFDTAPDLIEGSRQFMLSGLQNTLGMEVSDMLATCIYAYFCAGGGMVQVCGDGVVAVQYKDGRIVAHNFEWSDNMPYYPVYKNGLLKQFIVAHGDDISAVKLTEEIRVLDMEHGEFLLEEVKEYSLGAGIGGVTIEFDKQALGEIEFVAIFSDGVTQLNGVNWFDGVNELLSFKNVRGLFVKRRLIRGLQKLNKSGNGPFDDVSCAVIRMEIEGS